MPKAVFSFTFPFLIEISRSLAIECYFENYYSEILELLNRRQKLNDLHKDI